MNANFEAAAHLLRRGAPLSLSSAVCLGQFDETARLAASADDREKQFALVLCALNGKPESLRRMIGFGADVNRRSKNLHSHATPLHHAVGSGNLEAVKVLLEAGAKLDVKDTAWNGTPLDWANHYVREAKDEDLGKPYRQIADYLAADKAKRHE